MYSLKIHLICGIVSYILIWGYDFRDSKVKEVPYLIHQSILHYGRVRLFLGFLTIMVLGPLAVPGSALIRWWGPKR